MLRSNAVSRTAAEAARDSAVPSRAPESRDVDVGMLHREDVAGRQVRAAFESAGGHFNPGGRHTVKRTTGSSCGDLQNLQVTPNGPVKVEAVARDISLGAVKDGLLDADGSALVVHEGADDHRSDPAGKGGKRIAGGVTHR
jgi:Cu/Zn superoxide dismutase